MTELEIKNSINGYRNAGKRIFTTSSFQTHSLVLLHILSTVDASIPVYFIDTGYHFPETLAFRDEVVEEFGLNLLSIRSDTPKFMQRDADGRLLFASDPDHCCSINKTQPTEELLMKYDIWVNGVRRDQSAVRKAFNREEQAPNGAMRFHPMLNWNSKMIYEYRKKHSLPEHPLDQKGYMSIGCEPCTRKIIIDDSRDSRWYGMNKTECGLHTELVKK